MSDLKPLAVKDLYRVCDPSQFDFATTSDLEDLTEIIGQARALEAIHFGIGIKKDGYNIFALGPAGTGKHAVVTQLLSQKAASEPEPSDWCYLNNFDQPHKPIKLCLPKGLGRKLGQDMSRLVEELRAAIPALFESEEYRTRVQEIEGELKEKQETEIEAIRRSAKDKDVALMRTPNGFAFAPLRNEQVINPKDFKNLPDEVKQKFDSDIEELQAQLEHVLRLIPQWRREAREKLIQLNTEVAMSVVGHLIDELREQYRKHEAVVNYLNTVQQDVIANVDDFRRNEDEEPSFLASIQQRGSSLRRYEVNVLVDHTDTSGAPVVFEDNPTYQNLIGRVEHMAMMGALITDFTLIKSGALHRANNGYLVLEAYKLLQHPFSWEALKRALRSGEIHIGSLEQMLSLVSTVSLEPEPMPLNLKVVLVGDRILYYLLYQLDPEFQELFKVAADFDDRMDRSPEAQTMYARLIATQIRKEELRPFDKSAVARIIEHSARITEDAEKLSTHMRSICDLLCEADYWAQEHGREVATGDDVQIAINAQIRRSSRMKERLHENIQRNILLIDTTTSMTGQVNGLSVIDLGNVSFGVPTRITAQVRLGEGDVLDIEREVELGGPIHSKGVLILAGFLGARYAKDQPLALSASLVFEQSYGEIEGDSASSAELYALLSALAGVPVRQSFAVTGSVNQHGQVQAIGGVNEKIEGFFDICQARNLTGEQGVLIPRSNVVDLMLREDVREAVEQGKFHIYAVESIDQGIEILTGIPAGEADEEGKYPEGSINFKVSQQLLKFAEIRHEFGESKKEHDDSETHTGQHERSPDTPSPD
jgi:lon-related putative ATP-dependent protease